MTTTICIICLCSILFNVSAIVIRTLDIDTGHLNNLFHSLYWLQFSFNVFVYAASNKQYREAYRLFLREVVFRLDRDTDQCSTLPVVFGSRAERGDHHIPESYPQPVPEGIELQQIDP
jgi:hypothetical protein